MTANVFTIRWRNAYGNIGSGACLLALGVSLVTGAAGVAPLLSAVLLLACAGAALAMEFSNQREELDEMAIADQHTASAFALKATLALLGIACALAMPLGLQVSLSAFACIVIGLAMVLQGVSFAWLERC